MRRRAISTALGFNISFLLAIACTPEAPTEVPNEGSAASGGTTTVPAGGKGGSTSGTGGSTVGAGSGGMAGVGGTLAGNGGGGGDGTAGAAGTGATCPSGLASCGGNCIDLQTNAVNCGQCGTQCASGQTCALGVCACPVGQASCDGACVDTTGDGLNCGGCGVVCPSGQVCASGACSTNGCNQGLTQCQSSCVDLMTSAQHCGACATACTAGTSCSSGACGCPTGQSACGGRCLDTTSDSSNCGDCGVACGPGRVCRASACACPTGQTVCGETCADLNFSAQHCGACGTACGTGQACSAGTCTCSGGKAACGGACVDAASFQTDRANCGTCGNACPTNQICSAGKCGAGRGSCSGTVTVNPNPLGCELAWGANGNSGSRSSYLDFITTWVGDETNGGLNGDCGDCALVRTLASSNAKVGYYAYFIGFQANRQGGFGDCNTDMDGQNLCTGGAQWIKSNRATIIQMYANYARMTHEANPNKGVLWLLEGDFIQYTRSSQSSPLSLTEAGQLTNDIICAIKSNQPTAWVAMDHSAWNSNEETTGFWNAMPLSVMDFIWTTGTGSANGFITTGTTASSYNGATAKYSYLYGLTGKRILVDTSFGASQQADSWSDQSASTLNQRISEGIFAINVTDPPSDSTYQSRINGLGTLSSTCQ